jgi:ligand-binding sensor domain-containing protein
MITYLLQIRIRIICFTVLRMVLPCAKDIRVYAQGSATVYKNNPKQYRSYNLDQNNGLPTSFIYFFMVDHFGYLWMATPKGVARYNGYELKLFGLDNGLPYEDIWGLTEDNGGRIWLATIGNEIGYIENEQYQTALQDTGRIYPRDMVKVKNGVIILNLGTSNIHSQRLEIIYALGKAYKQHTSKYYIENAFLDQSARLIIKLSEKLYSRTLGKLSNWTYLRDIDSLEYQKKMGKNALCLFYDYLIGIDKRNNKLWMLNLASPDSKISNISPIHEKQEKIINAYSWKGKLFVIGSKRAYVLDSTLRVKETYLIPELTNNEKHEELQPYMVDRNELWGTLTGTRDKGIYIKSHKGNEFIRNYNWDLDGFRFVGNINDSAGYWWSNTMRTLALVGKKGIIRNYHHPHLFDIYKIRPHAPGIASLTSPSGTYWLSVRDGKLKPFTLNQLISNRNLRDAVVFDNSTIYAIPSARSTLVKLSTATTPSWRDINELRGYSHIVYDKSREGIWLYNDKNLGFYSIKGNKILQWDQTDFKKMGLKKIETLLVDNEHGNIFIKERENIYLFDDVSNQLTPVFPRYIYSDCALTIDKNILTIYGRFGLLQLRITGRAKLKYAYFLQNTKQLYYNTIYDVQVLKNQIWLKTDKGLFQVTTHSSQSEKHSYEQYLDQYRIILSTRDTTQFLHAANKLSLDPHYPVVHFDVINPNGSGKLMFEYREKEGNTWEILKDNQLNFTGQSNKRLTLSVRARDAMSRSPAYELAVFIKPYWWQSPKYIVWISLLFLIAGVVMAWIIRKFLIKRFEQKQLLAELALKGVHAQINPHFIHNTLTSAQYFIRADKPQQAYDHINKFSKILRNFLTASKYKYITIQDEIDNLNDYIALQQTRFADKFDYRIYVAPIVNIQQKIPSLLLQPLVENAIIHGLNNKKEKGNLLISFTWNNNLQICIDDDGIGREQAKEIQNQSILKTESHGSDLLKRLLQIFNQYEKTKIEVHYIDKTPPESGTIVRVIIRNAPL